MTNLLVKIFIKNSGEVQSSEVRKAYGTLSSLIGIAINVILVGIKLALGFITSSVAIIADALNNLSDAGSSSMALISFKLAAKPADRDHPFGHARFEYIASMVVSFLILLVGFETLIDSVSVLIGKSERETISFSVLSIVFLGCTILFKLWLAVFYTKIGKKIDSSVIKAAAVDSLMDCISTGAVLASAIVIKLTKIQIIDTVMSLLVSLVIIWAGIKILNETKNSLLGEAPVDEQVRGISAIIAEYPEILGTHDLMIHNYGPNHHICSFHAEVDGAKDVFMLHDMIDNVERRIQDELNILCTIHMDPIVTDDEIVNELRNFVTAIIKEKVCSDITVHDFRTVAGNTHTNVIFDIVIPFEIKESPNAIVEKISKAVQDERENCYCVITVDRG